MTALTALTNRIYWYEQQIKEIDQVPDSLQSTEEPYRIDDLVWVKSPNGQCITRFCRGRVNGIITSQMVQVNGMPYHVENLCLRHELTTSGEDYHSEDTLFDSNSEMLMLYVMKSDDLPPASESTDSNNDESGDDNRKPRTRRTQQWKYCHWKSLLLLYKEVLIEGIHFPHTYTHTYCHPCDH